MTLDEYIEQARRATEWAMPVDDSAPPFKNACVRIAWAEMERVLLRAFRRGLGIGAMRRRRWAMDIIDAAWEEPEGWVYEIAVPEFVNGQSIMKIGYSTAPAERLKQLQTGNSHKLIVVHEGPATKRMEQAFHTSLKDHAVRGEWFESSEDSMALFECLDLVAWAWAQHKALREA